MSPMTNFEFPSLKQYYRPGFTLRPSGGPGSPRIHPIVGAAPVWEVFLGELLQKDVNKILKVLRMLLNLRKIVVTNKYDLPDHGSNHIFSVTSTVLSFASYYEVAPPMAPVVGPGKAPGAAVFQGFWGASRIHNLGQTLTKSPKLVILVSLNSFI